MDDTVNTLQIGHLNIPDVTEDLRVRCLSNGHRAIGKQAAIQSANLVSPSFEKRSEHRPDVPKVSRDEDGHLGARCLTSMESLVRGIGYNTYAPGIYARSVDRSFTN